MKTMLDLMPKRTISKLTSVVWIVFLLITFSYANASAFDVDIEYDPPSAEAFEEIEFKAVVKGAEAKSFLWEMGDGTKYKEPQFIHILYKRGGRSYTINLSVTDAIGKTVTKTITIEIQKRKEGCPTA